MEKHIIACIDASNYANSVAKGAGWLAKSIGVPVTLLHVLEAKGETALEDSEMGQRLNEIESNQYALNKERGETLLSIAHEKIQNEYGINSQKSLVNNQLLEQLKTMKDITRFVVVGKRGEDSSDDIGFHIEKMLQSGDRPLLVVDKEFAIPEKVLVAFDGSETMNRGVTDLAESPIFKNIECHVVMVGSETDENLAKLRWAKKTFKEAGVSVVMRLLQESSANKAITNYAEENNINCKVMGASSHSEFRKFLLGSESKSILKKSKGTLIILR